MGINKEEMKLIITEWDRKVKAFVGSVIMGQSILFLYFKSAVRHYKASSSCISAHFGSNTFNSFPVSVIEWWVGVFQSSFRLHQEHTIYIVILDEILNKKFLGRDALDVCIYAPKNQRHYALLDGHRQMLGVALQWENLVCLGQT